MGLKVARMNINNINYFGHTLYVDDSHGITAESLAELNEKLDWCKSVGIYLDGVPVHSYTLVAAMSYFLIGS